GLAAGQIALIGFELDVMRAVKKTLPQHAAYWIVEAPGEAPTSSWTELLAAVRAAGLDGLDVEASWPLGAEMVQQIHAEGFKLYVWTIDDPSVARRWERAGADGIATNRPGWMREKIAK